ncbi:MAG: polysaccharide biosynthesis/export family protein [Dysgonamonadaceae bacterium]|jgi:polysaccharide export outer membrane protein|nr:polysaccharide biosynthesis/export family protein [Dysgonamonadaceae bacterium]
MKKKVCKLLLSVIAVGFISSCSSNKEAILYFKDIDDYGQKFKSTSYYDVEPVIKQNDQLLITVSAPALYQEKVAQFNLPVSTYLTPGEVSVTPTTSFQTYTVDKDGYIDFPILGKVHLEGMTKTQAREHLVKRISEYIEEGVTVYFQIISFAISVQGEVFKPGLIKMESDRISVLDALGAAGGLTIFGDRSKVLLVRDNNGTIEHHRFDLTKSDIFNSPYFYLQQNDILFVEATRARRQESEYGNEDTYKLQRTSFLTTTITTTILSIISTIVTVVTLKTVTK